MDENQHVPLAIRQFVQFVVESGYEGLSVW